MISVSKDFAKSFYNSSAWKHCRSAFISHRINIDGGLCQECKERLGYIVHHRILLNEINILNPDITLSFDNLEYVCKPCHDKFEGHAHAGNKDILPKIVFDENGQPIIPPPIKK